MEGTKKDDFRAAQKSTDLGKRYERHVFALISLKCLLHPKIADFWIASNIPQIKKFDDVILHVTYVNGDKEIFLIQIKNKLQHQDPTDTKHKMVAEAFLTTKKSCDDFKLRTYQEAYKEIIQNEESLKLIEKDESTRIFWVLLTNRKVNIEQGNTKIAYKDVNEERFRPFITSRKYEQATHEESGAFTLENKTEENLEPEFLENFFFYPEQRELEEIEEEIQRELCGTGANSIVDVYLQYFYKYPQKPNIPKLSKIDLKLRLLSSTNIYDFRPPDDFKANDSKLIDTIKTFDITVIHEKLSERIIWNEILHRMLCYYQETIDHTKNWETDLSEDVQNKIKKKFPLLANESLTMKKLYLFMVTSRELPLYRQTGITSSDINILLKKLNIFSIIYNIDKTSKLSFPENVTTFQSMLDIDDQILKRNPNRMFISFRNRGKVPFNQLSIDSKLREHISADQYIQLYNSTISIGYDVSTKTEIYINRTLKRSLINIDELTKSDDSLIVIFNFPDKAELKIDDIPLELKIHDIFRTYCTKDYVGEQDSSEKNEFHIATTKSSYNFELLQNLISTSNKNTHYVFQYVDETYLNLLHTNGTITNLKSFIKEAEVEDNNLIKTYYASNVNIICNNAGVGKSMLLKYLLRKFPKEEWVVYLELSKDISLFDNIQCFEDFKNYLHNRTLTVSGDFKNFGNISNNSQFQETFKCFYKSYVESSKLVLLIDDFELIRTKSLLNVFKEAADKGFRLWIVARPELKEEYEHIFGVFSLELTEFTEVNQSKFFTRFFKSKFQGSKKSRRNKLRTIKKVTRSLDNTFIGKCQQTMMLAEIFEANAEIKLNSTSELYEEYLKVTISKCYTNGLNEFVIKTLSKAALRNCFPEKLLYDVLDKNELDCDVSILKLIGENKSKNSLVEFQTNRTPLFSHKTYAEYLTARWLSLTVKSQVLQETPYKLKQLLKQLYSQELTNVRWFFDKILEQQPKYYRVIDLSSGKTTIDLTDILGRNIFHYSMTYGERFFINKSLMNDGPNIVVKVPAIINDNQQFHKFHDCTKSFSRQYVTFKRALSMPDKDPVTFINTVRRYQSFPANENVNEIKEFYRLCLRQCLTDIQTESTSAKNLAIEGISMEETDLLLRPDYIMGLSPIDCAVLAGTLKNIELTLNNTKIYDNVSFSQFNEERYYILYHAVQNGFCNILRKLLTDKCLKGDVVKVRDSAAGMSLLHLAVKHRRIDCVEQLIDVDVPRTFGQDEDGNTALHLAADWDDENILRKLCKPNSIRRDISIFLNMKNKKGQSHLFCFAEQNNVKAVKILTKCEDIEIDAEDNIAGNNPFITSLLRNSIKKSMETLRVLHTCGADINFKNYRGMSALHYSVIKGHEKFVKQLIDWDVDVDCKNEHGVTPLIFAARGGKHKLVRLLLTNAADINCSDNNGWTALHHAVKMNQLKVTNILIEKKTNLNLKNSKGKTPLMEACYYNFPEIVQLLLDNNAKIQIYSKQCKCTALDICKQKGHKECQDKIEAAIKDRKLVNTFKIPYKNRSKTQLSKTTGATKPLGKRKRRLFSK